jgi:hypothetical protein
VQYACRVSVIEPELARRELNVLARGMCSEGKSGMVLRLTSR